MNSVDPLWARLTGACPDEKPLRAHCLCNVIDLTDIAELLRRDTRGALQH